MALVPGGGYADYAVHESNALPVPAGLSMPEAGAIPETNFTVWNNVFERGRLQPGERLLVHGGTSGIGTTAIQLAKAFGAIVMATAGSEEKCEAAEAARRRRRGQLRDHRFRRAVRDATGGRGADVILDMVGGDYLDRNLTAAAEEGRIVQIAFLEGSAGRDRSCARSCSSASRLPARRCAPARSPSRRSSRAPSRRRYGRSSPSRPLSRLVMDCFRSRRPSRRTGASTAASTSARSC